MKAFLVSDEFAGQVVAVVVGAESEDDAVVIYRDAPGVDEQGDFSAVEKPLIDVQGTGPAMSQSYKEFVNINGVKLSARLSEVIGRSVHTHTPAEERVAWLNTIERLEECLTIDKSEGEMLRTVLFRMAGGQR